jgi:hypothetical protein
LRLIGYLGVVALTGAATLFGVAGSATAGSTSKASVAADEPTSIVETYDYPDAAKILAERDILLKRGDGHLVLTDCVAGGDFIQVRSRGRDPFCFKASAAGAWVTLELSDAFLVFSDSTHTTVADFTVNGVSDSATVAPGGAEGIGEGGSPNGDSAVLLKLTAS